MLTGKTDRKKLEQLFNKSLIWVNIYFGMQPKTISLSGECSYWRWKREFEYKLSYSTFFNLSEEQVRSYIIRMFEEEVDGCEFSLSSYLLYEYEGNPVASVGGWIEGFGGEVHQKY